MSRRIVKPGLLLALFSVANLIAACGAEGKPAPTTRQFNEACEPIDTRLSETLGLLRGNNLAGAAGVLRQLEIDLPDAAEGLLSSLLEIISVLWQNGVQSNPLVLTKFSSLVDGLAPMISGLLAYLSTEGRAQTDALESVNGILTTCPQRSLVGALKLLLSRPELVQSLGELLADPLVESVVIALESDDGSTGEEGFIALIRVVIRAINNPNFVFGDLVNLIEPLFDLDKPPIGTLVRELELLLTPENIATVRALTVCLDEQIFTSSGRTGTEAVGALLYGLITSPELEFSSQLIDLTSALTLLNDPEVRTLLDAIFERLENDDELRESMKPAIRYLLEPTRARVALADLGKLFEAGLITDLVGLLVDLVTPCEPDATADASGVLD